MGETTRLLLVCLSALLLSTPAAANPHHGVNMSGDGMMSFVSKDVGNERWAMILHMDTLLAVGNVYRLDGGEPAFVWCPMKSMHGDIRDMGHLDDVEITFSCFGSRPCIEDCPGWDFIDDVTLPASFFLPPQR